MTKLHEEIWRTTLSEAVIHYDENAPRGEFVLVIAGEEEKATGEMTLEEAVERALSLTEEGMTLSEAAKTAAKECGFPKSVIYRAASEENG